MLGWIIPAPLAIAPIVTLLPPRLNRTAASFLTVSEVIIARAASEPRSGLRTFTHCLIPRKTFRIGNGTPIRPVEQTSTSCGLHFNPAAVSEVIFLASAMPRTPVQALAFPLFRITARTFPFFKCCWLTRTGPAFT